MVQQFQWRLMAEQKFCHFRISMEGSPVQGRAAVLASYICWKTRSKHQADSRQIIVPGSISDLARIGIHQAGSEARMFCEQTLDVSFVANPAGRNECHVRWAAAHEEVEYISMPKLFCNFVRRNMEPQSPLIDCSAGPLIAHWKIMLIDANADALRSSIEMPRDQLGVAKRSGHENVGLAAALNEETDDFLAITYHVLRRRGFMIDIQSVDVCAVVEQVFRDQDVGREMQWSLTIAAACVDESLLSGNEFLQALEQTESGRCVDINNCPARNSISG